VLGQHQAQRQGRGERDWDVGGAFHGAGGCPPYVHLAPCQPMRRREHRIAATYQPAWRGLE
jgi:hypothetical protein